MISCSFYLDNKINYNLRRKDYFVGKYSKAYYNKTQQSSHGGSIGQKGSKLNSIINEIKYRIINRLNFNR